MPRKARIYAPGCLHHIICRGIERRKIFRDDTDRNRFLQRLGMVLPKTRTQCYACALIPNHFHLLLKTGSESISDVMRRLLTGYAVTFNRRHRRYGRLFQNRYKSILCQEDTYLLELVRYIHLNPLRAGIVIDLKELNKYPYSGHCAVLGRCRVTWQDTDYVLKFFNEKKVTARKRYKEFVAKGILQGKRQDLIGGGMVRSSGGWTAVKMMRKLKIHMKGDERILGDSDFVEAVLAQTKEGFEEKYRLEAKGYDLDYVIKRVASIFKISDRQVLEPCKQPQFVQARSVASYWAVRKLSISGTLVGKKLGLTQSAVSRSAKRGEEIVRKMELSLE